MDEERFADSVENDSTTVLSKTLFELLTVPTTLTDLEKHQMISKFMSFTFFQNKRSFLI